MDSTRLPGRGNYSGREARNLEIALDFYDKAIVNWNYEAGAHYLSPDYQQHDPLVADGPEGLKAFINAFKAERPLAETTLRRAFVDGDWVILHVFGTWHPGHSGVAIVEMFRIDGDRIVEHFDVIQPVPPASANGNPMV